MADKVFTNGFLDAMEEEVRKACRAGAMPPQGDGERIVLGNYMRGKGKETDGFVMEQAWVRSPADAEEVTAVLDEAGIGSFIMADRSTSLMESLLNLAGAGWEVAGLGSATLKDTRYGEEGRFPVEGIVMRRKKPPSGSGS